MTEQTQYSLLVQRILHVANDMKREAVLWPANGRAQQTARLLQNYATTLEAIVSDKGFDL